MIDIFSLQGTISVNGLPAAKAGLEGLAVTGQQTAAALNGIGVPLQAGLSSLQATGVNTARALNGIESAALNGTKGFRQIVIPMTEAEKAGGALGRTMEGAGEKIKKGTAATEAHATGLKGMFGPLKQMAELYGVVMAIDFVGKAVEAAAALHELSQKTGASVEMLSVLAFAGKRADVTVGDLTMGFRGLSLSLGMLRDGTDKKVIAAFATIGLSAKDFIGLNTDQAFRKIVDAMSRLPDGLQKSEVAARLFGRAGAEMVPLLDDLAHGGFAKVTAEAEKFHAVVTEKMAKDADMLRDQWGDLTVAAQGLARTVIPTLTALAQALTTLFTTGPGDTWRSTKRELQGLYNVMTYGAYAGVVQSATDFASPEHQKAMRDARAGHMQGTWWPTLAALPPLLDTVTEKAEGATAALHRLELMMGNPAELPKDLGSPFPGQTIGTRNDRIDISGALHAPAMLGGAASDAAYFQGASMMERLRDGLTAGLANLEPFKRSFEQFMRNLFHGGGVGNSIKRLGQDILAGMGSIFMRMAAKAIAAAPIFQAIAHALHNPFAAGFALLAFGIALTALGASMGGVADGSGGGGGAGSVGRDQITQIHLTAAGAGGLVAPNAVNPMHFTILGPNDPAVHRQLAETVRNAKRSGNRF